MTWLHQCRLPGKLQITLSRKRPGAEWRCNRCGLIYLLEQRVVPHTGVPYWRWMHPRERHEEQPQDVAGIYSTHERADSEDGYEDRARIGFTKE